MQSKEKAVEKAKELKSPFKEEWGRVLEYALSQQEAEQKSAAAAEPREDQEGGEAELCKPGPSAQ